MKHALNLYFFHRKSIQAWYVQENKFRLGGRLILTKNVHLKDVCTIRGSFTRILTLLGPLFLSPRFTKLRPKYFFHRNTSPLNPTHRRTNLDLDLILKKSVQLKRFYFHFEALEAHCSWFRNLHGSVLSTEFCTCFQKLSTLLSTWINLYGSN